MIEKDRKAKHLNIDAAYTAVVLEGPTVITMPVQLHIIIKY